ncbi:MAG: protein kinase, partial [Candidatus Obscuribacterales bacterium]
MDSLLANSQTPSNPYFGRYDLPPTVVVRIAKLFDPKTLSAFSQVNNAWYRAIKGHTPIIRLDGLNLVIPGRYKGDHYSRYQILWHVNREEAAKINEAIGMEISFPSPTAQEVPLLIGKGAFGEFRIAKVVGEERYVGIKITENSKEIEKEALIQEALTGLPHLMPSLDYRTARVEGRLRLFQAMPLAGLGNLSRERNPEAPHKPTLGELIQGLKDHGFREQLIYHIAHSSLLGLQAMHGSQLYHLDFKGDNLVVDVNGEVWVIDFGLSGLFETGKEDTVKLIGDRRYYPFERMVCEKWKNHRPLFLATIDIWALGITLLELVHPGGNPFNMQQYGYLRDEGSYHSRLQGIEVLKDPTPDSLGSFISALLTVDPSNRPNATKALQHPWILKMGKTADQWRPACKSRLSEMVREHKRRAWMEGFSSSIGQLLVRQKRVEAPLQEKPEGFPPLILMEESEEPSLTSLGDYPVDPYPSRPDLDELLTDARSLPDELSFSDEDLDPPNVGFGRYRSYSDEMDFSPPAEILVPLAAPKDLLSPLTLPLPLFTDFVPRLALQKTLEESLFSNKRLTVLQGMGGAGKSKMALYLLHSEKVKEHFGLRLWFNAVDQKNSLESQILLLARELNLIDARASMEEAFEAFYRYLGKQPKPYLIVFDNADDPESLLPHLPKEKGHVLITTRNASWPDAVPVGVLSVHESLLLIERLLQK